MYTYCKAHHARREILTTGMLLLSSVSNNTVTAVAVATHGAEVHSEYNSLFQESRNGKDAGKELKRSRQFLEGLFHYSEVCE